MQVISLGPESGKIGGTQQGRPKMETNALPTYDMSDNPTGCCPQFNPEGWDDRELHFEDKLFLKAKTASENYVPTDMGAVFVKTFEAMENARAFNDRNFIVLSRDVSPSEAEHFFAVAKPVPGEEMVRWSGDYVTKVFEGPFEDAAKWHGQLIAELKEKGLETDKVYFFYTTCLKCAQAYGKNYVVAVARLASGQDAPN